MLLTFLAFARGLNFAYARLFIDTLDAQVAAASAAVAMAAALDLAAVKALAPHWPHGERGEGRGREEEEGEGEPEIHVHTFEQLHWLQADLSLGVFGWLAACALSTMTMTQSLL